LSSIRSRMHVSHRKRLQKVLIKILNSWQHFKSKRRHISDYVACQVSVWTFHNFGVRFLTYRHYLISVIHHCSSMTLTRAKSELIHTLQHWFPPKPGQRFADFRWGWTCTSLLPVCRLQHCLLHRDRFRAAIVRWSCYFAGIYMILY
jgi:hypothetical protein